MKRKARYAVAAVASAALAASVALAGYGVFARSAMPGKVSTGVGRPPRISPDYSGVTLPPNIAPLTFRIDEPAARYYVEIKGSRGGGFSIRSGDGSMRTPCGPWSKLLEAEHGGELEFTVDVRGKCRQWRQFAPFTVQVAAEPIDPYVVYRSMNPIYRVVVNLALRQRDLTSYDDDVVLSNKGWGGCVNCHTFYKGSPDDMLFHLRSGRTTYGQREDARGHGMVLVRDDEIRKIDARTEYSIGFAAYSSWHPNGKVIAFSMNKVRQFFHSARTDVRDVLDIESDLAIYLTDTDEVTSTRALCSPDRLENWPMWSPDGKYLYFCSAPVLWEKTEQGINTARYTELKYGLMRLPYDAETGAWGKLETVLSAEQTGLSINQPRFSPDGRFLVFCMSDYSNFPAFRPSSDRHLMDMATGDYHRMACNSDFAESWHSWSSNGRWLAFTSKRPDGQFLKIHFTYVDEEGRDRKPFIMPQRDPAYYDSFVRLNQLPELITKPIPISERRFVTAIETRPLEKGSLPVTSATASLDPGAALEGEGQDDADLPIWTVQ